MFYGTMRHAGIYRTIICIFFSVLVFRLTSINSTSFLVVVTFLTIILKRKFSSTTYLSDSSLMRTSFSINITAVSPKLVYFSFTSFNEIIFGEYLFLVYKKKLMPFKKEVSITFGSIP